MFLRQYQLHDEHDNGNKFSCKKFRMYTKWWTFLLTRIYLCVNNGHYNNFHPVLIIFRCILITFINIINA